MLYGFLNVLFLYKEDKATSLLLAFRQAGKHIEDETLQLSNGVSSVRIKTCLKC